VATRYRCSACGNLTRFDVVTSRRTRAFHHYTIGGELQVEDEAVLDATVEHVSCRWCGSGAAVEAIDDAAAARAERVAMPAAVDAGSPEPPTAAGDP
jgi:hypothetical protein